MAGDAAMKVVVAIAQALTLLAIAAPARTAGDRREVGLLPMSREQVRAAGAAGTGCSFLADSGQLVIFAASDDRAVVRTRGGVIELRPAHGARDMFPFTFDRWTGGGLSLSVLAMGKAVRRGVEALERPAVVSVRMRGVKVDHRGRLSCGS